MAGYISLKEFTVYSEEETLKVGEALGSLLDPGAIVCLYGEIGSGKTYFTKGIGKGLLIDDNIIRSPSFTIMNLYKGRVVLYHFDLYRLSNIDEIEDIGIREYFYGEGVSVLEWSERLDKLLPDERIDVKFNFIKGHPDIRQIKMTCYGEIYKDIITALNKLI